MGFGPSPSIYLQKQMSTIQNHFLNGIWDEKLTEKMKCSYKIGQNRKWAKASESQFLKKENKFLKFIFLVMTNENRSHRPKHHLVKSQLHAFD